MKPKRIAIVGMGGVGGYYGGLLARAGHPVFALARGANLEALKSSGLEVRTPDDRWTARIIASADPTALSQPFEEGDLVIVATKAYSLTEVAPAIKAFARRGSFILPLLNGVDIAEQLASLGIESDQIVGGLTYISAVRVAPGVVERRSPFQRIIVGELSGGMSSRCERIAASFRDAGVDAVATENVALALWQKFVFLSSISAVCGLARSAVGPVRQSPLGQRAFGRAVREAVLVGRARGIPLPDDEEQRVLSLIDSLPDAMRPSLLLDLESGTPTEVAVLSGAISRMAEELGIETPIHDMAATAFGLHSQPTARQKNSLLTFG